MGHLDIVLSSFYKENSTESVINGVFSTALMSNNEAQ